MNKRILGIILCLLSLNIIQAQSENESRLFRFPTVNKDNVVFTYAGDLYTVAIKGGIARKLTNDIGYEMFAKYSPDGKNIAFTGQYDGNTEVYLIPSEGGIPKRLTYTATLSRDDISDRMGPNNIIMCWKDDNSIVYRSRKKTFNDFKGQLFVANINGGLSEELPLPCGGFCSWSPDKTKLAYNQVFREFRTWKYYKGGMADDIWIYDFKTKKTENITNNIAQDIFPMWKGDYIYFISDRNRTMNLFSYNIVTKEIKKLTNYIEFDIKFPSLGTNSIVYENGGYIYNFDINTQKAEKISIKIADDFNSSRPELIDASKFINSSAIAPDGKRVVFGARGDLFTVPAKTGITHNLTQSSGVHDRNAEWSPDGKYIAYISDITGEDEVYIIKQDGSSKPEQLTKNSDTYKYYLVWSPDAKKIMWSDKMQRLQFVDIESKKVTLIDKALDGEIYNYTWSPDSRFIAYPRPDRSSETMIYIYDLAADKKYPVTSGWYSSDDPAFSDNGKYLFFTSNRDFNPTYSWTEWNHIYKDMTKVYFLTLTKAEKSPLAPVNDEVDIKQSATESQQTADKAKTKDKAKDKEGVKKEEVIVKFDFEGIENRIIDLPTSAGSYNSITCTGDNVYYMKAGSGLMMYDLKNKKEIKIGDFRGYEISADKKKILVLKDGRYAVTDLPKGELRIEDYIDLSNMKLIVNLKEEWKQIYYECWRQMRDFFYDPNMHKVDWKAMQLKYGQLLPYINHRNDLNYIIGELIGELNVGHAYIGGGDRPQLNRIKTGLLGAELSRDKSGYYKIVKIFKGENWAENTRSPLTEVGVDINEGDFIIAVNGKATNKMNDIYEALVNTASKQVELTVNNKPEESGSRKTIIIPIDNEAGLYYYNWVQTNIKKVNEATNGKVGYIHIPDMGPEGLTEFAKYFYPQLDKKALIIDDRGNGGGNVSQMILERLVRTPMYMRSARNMRQYYGPDGMQVGPKICLIDRYSASDGDLFPYKFRKMKLGKLIGQRTWGGVVGIRGSLPLIDGGSLNKPEFSHFDYENNKWIIEGEGVVPDIIVNNDPAKEYAGEDEQLNKAIEIILEELKNYKEELPDVPPFPDKTK